MRGEQCFKAVRFAMDVLVLALAGLAAAFVFSVR